MRGLRQQEPRKAYAKLNPETLWLGPGGGVQLIQVWVGLIQEELQGWGGGGSD